MIQFHDVTFLENIQFCVSKKYGAGRGGQVHSKDEYSMALK